MKRGFFTFGGKENNKNKVYYDELPKEILSKLDVSITERCVHLDSTFAKAAIEGGYDPEKVSYNVLKSIGLIKDNKC